MNIDQSPLLVKYLKNHINNPGSKAFAPLAEAYRKIGKVEKAMDLLREGLQTHPGYVSALVTLAQCHQDLNRYDLAYTTLKTVVDQNIENLLLLKIFAVACEKTNHVVEAGQTYKYLLFLNPKSEVYAEKVEQYGGEDLALDENKAAESDSEEGPVFASENDLDQWEAKAFFKETHSEEEELEEIEVSAEPKKRISPAKLVLKHQSTPDLGGTEDNPVMTLTLVDLYCQQGIWDKAKDVLEHLQELRPNDALVRKKLASVNEALHENADEGRTHLMDLIDKKLAPKAEENKISSVFEDKESSTFKDEVLTASVEVAENSKIYEKLEENYNLFLRNIKSRARSRCA